MRIRKKETRDTKMTAKKTYRCGHCGQEIVPGDANKVFQSEDGHSICFDCIEAIYKEYIGKVSNARAKKEVIDSEIGKMTPIAMKEYLDKYIIGQDKAKKVLCTTIYNHYNALKLKAAFPDLEIDKSNICIVGPTGSGKTASLKKIAKILDVPFTMADANSLTAAGYVGADVETVLRNLISEANGDVEKAQHGIVYIDEIDKIRQVGVSASVSGDPGHGGVQQALLKMIEGSIMEVPDKGQRKHPEVPVTKIDTTDILFIVGGAFEGIEKIIAKRQNAGKSKMGFGASLLESSKIYNDLILDVRTDDLKTFGLMPEFIGRLPVICPMQELTRDDLVRILIEPNNAIVKQYQFLFAYEDVELEFTDDALNYIADEAIKRKTGARSLRSILEEILGETMYKLPSNKNIDKMTVDYKNGEITFSTEYKEKSVAS